MSPDADADADAGVDMDSAAGVWHGRQKKTVGGGDCRGAGGLQMHPQEVDSGAAQIAAEWA